MTALKFIHVCDWGPGTIILIHGGKYYKMNIEANTKRDRYMDS